MSSLKQLAFHVLVETQDGGYYLATCLETGLVATSLDQDDVVSKMSKLIARTVEFAVKHNRLADVFHPAPNEVFNRYMAAKGPALGSSQKAIRLDHGPSGLAINQTAYAAAAC
jgi:hypothetical protein